MARVTVDDCLEYVDNHFDLVKIAAKRAHQLNNGTHKTTLDKNGDKPTVIALREIELGIINNSILIDDSISFTTNNTNMSEIEEELNNTKLDNKLDNLSEVIE